ncbi:RNA 2',3'-cyclic phosphodiesterase [Zestomonas carbonaria]|uniref:RNA 2',3'-cyclic phosphodiesterase n=1 Tax=Zestomonas carbonaria TaxID=2762745 RepID=A0A7U7ERA9_9GAMM|nr:RNA 2',3'-cyclic phosphodiesterase [Pseudomonas carbonaria]CAD5108755.1 RNA 2',3'-cyclic phosphodiesterase [Pseudomonas carbonaria]
MSTPPLRLFFALPCPAETARAMADWRDGLELSGRPVAAENLHITLAFLGAQPRGRLDELKTLAAGVTGDSFELRLDSLGHWRNGLLHLVPSQTPEALLALEQALRERLLHAGFALETRPFRPHLTLVRHCTKAPGATQPDFAWRVGEFALFVSEHAASGSRYKALGRWPLRA